MKPVLFTIVAGTILSLFFVDNVIVASINTTTGISPPTMKQLQEYSSLTYKSSSLTNQIMSLGSVCDGTPQGSDYFDVCSKFANEYNTFFPNLQSRHQPLLEKTFSISIDNAIITCNLALKNKDYTNFHDCYVLYQDFATSAEKLLQGNADLLQKLREDNSYYYR